MTEAMRLAAGRSPIRNLPKPRDRALEGRHTCSECGIADGAQRRVCYKWGENWRQALPVAAKTNSGLVDWEISRGRGLHLSSIVSAPAASTPSTQETFEPTAF